MAKRTPPEIEIIGGYPALGRVESTFDVPATKVTETLWVNRDMELDDKGEPDFRNTWVVTHEPTGWSLVRWLPSKAAAKAAALWLAAIGFDGITTDDAKEADAQVTKAGIQKAKLFLAEAIDSLSTEKLIKALQKAERAGSVPAATRSEGRRDAAKRGEARPSSKAKKATKKKAAKKAGKKKKTEAPAPPGEPDFMAMLREAEGNPLPAEDTAAKQRLLEW